MDKILVVGGAGYIGSHISNSIPRQNLVILDDLSAGNKQSVPEDCLYVGDYSDKKILDEIFRDNKINSVIIMAAFASVPDSIVNPINYYQNNVAKLLGFLEYVVNHDVKNILFSSSASVYGNPQYLPIDESHPKFPISPYGRSKLMGEEIIKDIVKSYGLNYAIIRYFNASGASPTKFIGESHNPEHHLIPRLIQNAEKGIKTELFGNDYKTKDGYPVRDFIHVEDLSELHLKSLEYISENKVSLTINAGSGKGTSINEVKNLISKFIPNLEVIISDRRNGDPEVLLADITLAKTILNWKPKHGIKRIIKDTIEWERMRKF
jgi:UDP-glucose 4-epimerase